MSRNKPRTIKMGHGKTRCGFQTDVLLRQNYTKQRTGTVFKKAWELHDMSGVESMLLVHDKIDSGKIHVYNSNGQNIIDALQNYVSILQRNQDNIYYVEEGNWSPGFRNVKKNKNDEKNKMKQKIEAKQNKDIKTSDDWVSSDSETSVSSFDCLQEKIELKTKRLHPT